MTVKFVQGDPGEGKTLYAVMEAHFHYWQGWNIAANINLHKIPYKRIKDVDDLFNLGPGNWFVILDEFWATMDSRRSGSLINLEGSKWALQHRKTAGKIEVWMTQQYESQMDLRVCNIAKERYYPRCIMREDLLDSDSPPVFLQITKVTRDRGRFIKSVSYQPVHWELDGEDFNFLETYDTYQTVDPMTASHEKEFEKYVKTFKNFDRKSDIVSYLQAPERGKDVKNPTAAKFIADYIMMKRRTAKD